MTTDSLFFMPVIEDTSKVCIMFRSNPDACVGLTCSVAGGLSHEPIVDGDPCLSLMFPAFGRDV